METIVINKLMRLIDPLSVDLKLELLSKLSDSLKTDFKSNKTEKEVLFEELYGAWSDMDDDLEKEILESRTVSEREVSVSCKALQKCLAT
jgi:hypothetical protein